MGRGNGQGGEGPAVERRERRVRVGVVRRGEGKGLEKMVVAGTGWGGAGGWGNFKVARARGWKCVGTTITLLEPRAKGGGWFWDRGGSFVARDSNGLTHPFNSRPARRHPARPPQTAPNHPRRLPKLTVITHSLRQIIPILVIQTTSPAHRAPPPLPPGPPCSLNRPETRRPPLLWRTRAAIYGETGKKV